MQTYGTLRLPSKPSRKRRILRYALAAAALLLVIAVIAYALARTTPAWYQPLRAEDPDVDNLAYKLELHTAELYNQAQNAAFEDKVLTITQDEINAELAMWQAKNARPGKVEPYSSPMVAFTPGLITLCARVPQVPGSDPAGGVLSVGISLHTVPPDPTVTHEPGNQIAIGVAQLWVGRLPLPPAAAREQVNKVIPALMPAIRQALQAQSGAHAAKEWEPVIADWLAAIRDGKPFTPTPPAGPSRRIMVKSVQVTDGQLSITLGPPPKK